MSILSTASLEVPFSLVDAAIALFSDRASEKERKQRVNILLRKLYAETRANLDILELVKTENLKDDWLKSVKAVAPLLKNEAASLVLLGTDDCFREIKLIQEDINDVWKVNSDDDGTDSDDYRAPENFKQAVAFCTNKINVLKSYASINESDKELFKRLIPSRRIANIHNYLLVIKKALQYYLGNHSK